MARKRREPPPEPEPRRGKPRRLDETRTDVLRRDVRTGEGDPKPAPPSQ